MTENAPTSRPLAMTFRPPPLRSRVIQHVLASSDREDGTTAAADRIIVSTLRAAAKAARTAVNSAMTETILMAVGQLGWSVRGPLRGVTEGGS